MSAESAPEHRQDNQLFVANFSINYLSVRMTWEGIALLQEQREIFGEMFSPGGSENWLGLEISVDDQATGMQTDSYPRDGPSIEGYVVRLSQEEFERVIDGKVVGSEQAQGISLRQVRILPPDYLL